MKSIKSFWHAPALYFRTPKETWIFVLSTGIFVFSFLTFFQPFGVNNYDPTEKLSPIFVIAMLLFGVIVSLGLAFNEFIIKPRIKVPMTQGGIILWIGWNLFSLSTILFIFYNYLGEWHDLSWRSYLEFIQNLSITGILPVLANLFYFYIKQIKSTSTNSNVEQTALLDKLIVITSENEKERLAYQLSQILYIESQDNYVAIYFIEDDRLKKKLIRSSLKRLENQELDRSIIRTHRSFIVNMTKVISYQGNQHGLQLKLAEVPQSLPVSRTYVSSVLDILEK